VDTRIDGQFPSAFDNWGSKSWFRRMANLCSRVGQAHHITSRPPSIVPKLVTHGTCLSFTVFTSIPIATSSSQEFSPKT
jgi:hypothetical protein